MSDERILISRPRTLVIFLAYVGAWTWLLVASGMLPATSALLGIHLATQIVSFFQGREWQAQVLRLGEVSANVAHNHKDAIGRLRERVLELEQSI